MTPEMRAEWRQDFSHLDAECNWSEDVHLALLDALEAAEAEVATLRETLSAHERMRWPEEAHRLKQRGERLAAALEDIGTLAEVQAIACRAQYRADHERNWLDVLAIIERSALASASNEEVRCDGSCHDRNEDDCPKCGSLDVGLVCDDCLFYLAQDAEPSASSEDDQ